MNRTPVGRLMMFTVVAVCLGIMLGTGSIVSGAAPGRPADTPVKVTFRNATGDRFLSIGHPTYTNAQSGVEAVLEASTGSLRLVTCVLKKGTKICSSSGRYHFFDYAAPANQLLPLPAATITAPAVLQLWVFDSNGVDQLANGFRGVMSYQGEQRQAGMKVNHPYNNTMYTLRFTPNFYAFSDYLTVTFNGGLLSCSVGNPDACASWTVTNSSPADDLAEFVTGDNSKDYGQFHIPFEITIAVLPR